MDTPLGAFLRYGLLHDMDGIPTIFEDNARIYHHAVSIGNPTDDKDADCYDDDDDNDYDITSDIYHEYIMDRRVDNNDDHDSTITHGTASTASCTTRSTAGSSCRWDSMPVAAVARNAEQTALSCPRRSCDENYEYRTNRWNEKNHHRFDDGNSLSGIARNWVRDSRKQQKSQPIPVPSLIVENGSRKRTNVQQILSDAVKEFCFEDDDSDDDDDNNQAVCRNANLPMRRANSKIATVA